MLRRLSRLMRGKKGQSGVEYVLIIALIVIALIGTYTAFKDDIAALFTKVGDQIANTIP